ncbi:hypothetical protein V6Z11_A12G032000 [Gossypium hirsutum]
MQPPNQQPFDGRRREQRLDFANRGRGHGDLVR